MSDKTSRTRGPPDLPGPGRDDRRRGRPGAQSGGGDPGGDGADRGDAGEGGERAGGGAAQTGFTTRLAQYAAALRYEDIPAEVKLRIKNTIIDTVAVILYGGQLPWSQMVIAHAKRTGPGGKSAILGGGGVKVQAPSAALAHGTMAHAFELDNLTDPNSGSHPGAAMFSSGLAVAQERGLSGRDLMLAMTAGAEVMIRIGLAAKGSLEPRGFHAPGTTGPFGGAVTVRQADAVRPDEDDQRARHRGLAVGRAARVRAFQRRRHGEEAASRSRGGIGRAGGEPRGRRIRRALDRDRRRSGLSRGVRHRARFQRADEGLGPRLRQHVHHDEALRLPRDGAPAGRRHARSHQRAQIHAGGRRNRSRSPATSAWRR